jgi:AcrR family transcriptional regulator
MQDLSSVNRGANGDSAIRSALIEAAARLIAVEGGSALTLRRVAEEVGTSTMAIYTYFGGMSELRRAVRREGYARLAAQVASVEESDDPVADLAMLGRVYYENAIGNPPLYRAMFMEQPLDQTDAATGSETRDSLVAAIQRCIDAGRFAPAEAEDLAREFWALGHGGVTLQLAQLMSPEQAQRCLAGAMLKLFRAYGDDADAVTNSLARAASREHLPRPRVA